MEQQNITPGQSWEDGADEQSIDIRKILNKAIVLWPWILLSSALIGGLSLAFLYFSTPTYKVNAKILIKDDAQKKGGGGLGGAMQMLQNIGITTGASSVDNELEIIQSYTLMNKTVSDMQLNVLTFRHINLKSVECFDKDNPFNIQFTSFNDSVLHAGAISYNISVEGNKAILKDEKSDRIFSGLLGDTIKLLAGNAIVNKNPEFREDNKGGEYSVIILNQDAITRSYMKSLDASIPNKQVSTIALVLPSSVPRKGEKILNTLIKEYMQSTVDDNNSVADSTMRFIDERLSIVGNQLTDIENDIQSFKQHNKIVNLGAQAQALVENTSDYTKQEATQEVQLSVITALEKYLKDNIDNPSVVPASLLVQDPTLSTVIQQYNTLVMQRSRLLLGTTENNPMVKNLDDQIGDIRSNLMQTMISVKHSAEVALNSIRRNSGLVQNQMNLIPAKERTFLDYSRQDTIRQALYLFLLQKREETAISRSSTMANARIIDAATAEEAPFKPKKKVIFGVALLLGALLPFVIVYLRDLLNTKIKTKDDIERETKVPILGEIGHNDEANFVTVTKKSRSLVAEQFRALRANLQFLFTNKEDKVIMMTSSMSGEGKSFIATNLAMVFALADKKVVLLELDLRKPKIMSSLELKFDKGFSQYAIGAATLDQIIYPSGIHENLFIIPAGPIPPNPSELILHERTTAMFAALKEQFDYIIVDTTPNLVSDAQLLSVHADATLYVARLEYTRKGQLHIPDRLSKQGKLPKLNLVINDIKPKRSGSGYYGYGYGGYGYGYGYGYGEYLEGASTKKQKSKKA